MAHNIQVQDNDVVFKSTDPGTDISLSVHGEVKIGKGTTTDVISAMNGANLLIRTTEGGHLVVSTMSTESTGILEINNVQWPVNFDKLQDGATMFVDFDATDGQFKLKYRKMSLGTLSSSNVTTDALNSLFPSAKPGQFVTTPGHLYLNSDKDTWHSLMAFPVSESGEPGTGIGTVTSVDVLGGTTGLTTAGGPVIQSGAITLGGVLNVIHGGTGASTPAAARSALGAQETLVSGTNVRTVNGVSILGSGNIAIPAGSGGTVTSVNFLGGTTGLTTSGGPITDSGAITLAGTLSVANGGTGSTSASAARSALDAQQTLVSGTSIKTINGTSILGSGNLSIPAVTSVNFLGGTTGLTTSGGPITDSGTITLGGVLGVSNGGTGSTTTVGALTSLGAQAALISGTNIKTVNGVSLLGSGNIAISSGGGGGTVTSVNFLGGSTGLTTSGGPITSSGTITLGGVLGVSNGGTGSTSASAARVSLDAQQTLISGTSIKTINGVSLLGSGNIVIGGVTSVGLSGGTTGLTTSGGPITSAGTMTLGGTLSIANGGTGSTSASAARVSLDAQQTLISGTSIKTINGVSLLGSGNIAISSGGTGTVTSVGLSGGSTGLTTSGGPITSSGTITLAGTLSVANGGTGSTSASAARSALDAQQTLVSGTSIKTINGTSILGSGNIAIGGVTSVGLSGGSTGLTTTGGPITSSGTITLAGTLSVANGGTGSSTAAGALKALLPAQSGNAGGVLTTNGSTPSWTAITGLTSGSASKGFIQYNGTTPVTGQWDGGGGAPVFVANQQELKYNGMLVSNDFKTGNLKVSSASWTTLSLTNAESTTAYGVIRWQSPEMIIGPVTNAGATAQSAQYLSLGAGGTTAAYREVIRISSGMVRIPGTQPMVIGLPNAVAAHKLCVGGSIYSSTSSIVATSDARYKESVRAITGALNIVKALRPVSFEWKSHPVHNFANHRAVGFLAQEVAEAVADTDYIHAIVSNNTIELKDGTSEEFMGLAEGSLISILTAAVQELARKVETLESLLMSK